MSKQEFLDGLRRSLAGNLETHEVNEHIQYYSDYIDSQIRRGVLEEEVMASLGEPRLIAKTLIGMENVETVTEEYVDDEAKTEGDYRQFQVKGKNIRIPSWLFTILVCFVSFFILSIIFSLMTRLLPFIFMFIFMVTMIRFLKNLFR